MNGSVKPDRVTGAGSLLGRRDRFEWLSASELRFMSAPGRSRTVGF
jgi:hypothetical protein